MTLRGYYFDEVLFAPPVPLPERKLALTGPRRRALWVAELQAQYRAGLVVFRPPEREFHVVAYCPLAELRPTIRAWLHARFPRQVASLAFLEGAKTLQNVADLTAGAITRYRIKDFCAVSPKLLASLDMKLPNQVRLSLFDLKSGVMSRYNRRHAYYDGPEIG